MADQQGILKQSRSQDMNSLVKALGEARQHLKQCTSEVEYNAAAAKVAALEMQVEALTGCGSGVVDEMS